jgi:hypothetical protein
MRKILSVVSILSLLVTLAIAGAANSASRINVHIPFDFTVGKVKLKAGSYAIDSATAQGVQRIRSEDCRTSVFFSTYGGQTRREPSRSKLVFHRYGDQYFLSEIWDEGSTVAMQLAKSRAERELEHTKYLAKNAVEPETITVMAQ